MIDTKESKEALERIADSLEVIAIVQALSESRRIPEVPEETHLIMKLRDFTLRDYKEPESTLGR